MKRDLKSKKTDKKSINKKSRGNPNFRSINNYQIDKIPNDNLYKNDNLYSIDKNFEFPQNQENTFRLFHHYHYQKDKIKYVVILLYIRLLTSRMNKILDIFSIFKLLNFKNILHFLSFFISYLFTNEVYLKKDLFNLYIYYIFTFNQCIHIFSCYYNLKPINDEYLPIKSEIIFNLTLKLFLNVEISNIIFLNIIIICTYLYTSNSFFGLVTIFYSGLGIILAAITYIIIMKSTKEVWALYDSFKRSYYNMNQGLLESDPNPIFIISKDKSVLYRNTASSKLINNILEKQSQNSPRRIQRNKDDKLSNMSFLDIIHPNLKELFKKLLNDLMEDENVGTFNFPLCKINNDQNLDINVSNAYDINDEKNYLYFVWYSILVCKTEWKNKTAFYMCLFPSEDVLINEIFYQYTKRFSEKIEKVISNSDIINLAFLNKKDGKSNSSLSINSKLENEGDNLSNESKEKKELASPKKNILKLLIDNIDNIELNNTILFFFKNQVELLYDYSLTIEIYFTMLYKQRNFKYTAENKKPNLKKRIKLSDLQAYYSEYFYDFIKEHKYKFKFKNDEDTNLYYIYIEENYLRIIMFNVIIFMICCLDDQTEPTINNKKEIIIKLIPEIKEDSLNSPETPESNMVNEDHTPKLSDSEKNIKKGELSFIFEAFALKADLNKIQELINQKNKNNCQVKSEIIKLNYLDIGILTIKYLLENYYKTKLEMSSKEGEQMIQFKLPCELELLTDSTNSKSNFYNNTNITPDSSPFFTSPLLHNKPKINKPKNFYNYNKNYNKKVLNIFYGIEKSPLTRSRHFKGIPSFSELNLNKNKERRFLRHISQNFNKYVNRKYSYTNMNNEENKIISFEDSIKFNEEHDKNNKITLEKKSTINQFSFKQIDFSFDSDLCTFKSDKIEEGSEYNNSIIEIKTSEVIEKDDVQNKKKLNQNKVLIIESPKTKDFISFLNNENKGEYILKIIKDEDIAQIEKELKENDGVCIYEVLLINMGNIKEIKYAENVCEKKGDSLIFGYHFGVHTKSKEKNNVKFDKRFDLSFSYEGILYALKQAFINNSSIIK